ncbi:MAG: ABC transporter ATP-binding protein [Acidimicrobiales bacterium]
MTPLLEINGLGVNYGRAVAVRDISLSVNEGEVVGLLGPNGAGKSSTLLAVMGAVRRAAGTISLRGRSLQRLAPESVARLGVAIVPEGRHLFHSMSVAENLAIGRLARRADQPSRVDEAWVAGLFPVIETEASRAAGLLSGGQQQQVAIARALLSDPDLLLLDEPSLGLSPTATDNVFEALDKVRARGVSMLLVEQRAQRAIEFCDRSYILSTGEVRLEVDRSTADLSAVVAAYLGAGEQETKGAS